MEGRAGQRGGHRRSLDWSFLSRPWQDAGSGRADWREIAGLWKFFGCKIARVGFCGAWPLRIAGRVWQRNSERFATEMDG